MNCRIPIVDDDLHTTHNLSRFLTVQGYQVEQVNDPTQTLSVARLFQPDVVILDFMMPAMHGAEVAWRLAGDRELVRTPAVLMLSGLLASEFEMKLPPINITLLEKPVDREALLKLLRETTDQAAQRGAPAPGAM